MRFIARVLAGALALGVGLALLGLWGLSFWGGLMYARQVLLG